MIVVRWFLVFLVTAMLALSTFVTGAMAETVLRLSLPEAERLWQAHNREVKLASVAVRGAEADQLVAGQAPNPQISLNVASISPNEGFGAGGPREKMMDSILRLEQLIERGNKRELRVQAASARLDATQHDYRDMQRQQRLALWSTYYDLLLAQEKKHGAAATLDLYTTSLEASEIRLKAGDISQTDLSRLRVEKLRADNDARQAVADCEMAQLALAYLIGQEVQARSLVAADDWPALERVTGEVGIAQRTAQRPDIKAAQARWVAAEVARDLARSLKQRDVTVGVQLEHNLQNAPRNSFGVGVSVPLFVRSEYEGEIARAEADLELARQQLEKAVAQAIGEADRARSQLAATADRRQRLESELLIDAERVAQAAEFAYSKGAMSLIDLLDARRTWRQVQLEAAQARADYAKARALWHMLTAWEKP